MVGVKFQRTMRAAVMLVGIVMLVSGPPLHAITATPTIGQKLYVAGRNDDSQLGTGDALDVETPVEVNLPGGVLPKEIEVGWGNIFVIGEDDQLYSTGYNQYGHLGVGTATPQNSFARFQLPALLTVKEIVHASSDNLWVLASNDQIYGAGRNQYGDLGNGNTTPQYTPVRFALPGGVSVVEHTGGQGNSLQVLGSDGNVYGAGRNSNGQLGVGDALQRTSPALFQLPVGEVATQLHANQVATFVVTQTGRMFAAGYNYTFGWLGVNSAANQITTPAEWDAPLGVTVSEVWPVVHGSQHSLYVLGSDNNLYASGRNVNGFLGDGSLTNRIYPVETLLPGAFVVDTLYSSQGAMYAIGTNGSIYGWGGNFDGELGVGDTNPRSTPVAITLPGGATGVRIVNQTYSTMILASDGELYGAGYNGSGSLGAGSVADTSQTAFLRFQLPVGVTVTEFDHYGDNTFVIGSDGQFYGAGYNGEGQLGDGTVTPTNTPVAFGLPSGVSATDFLFYPFESTYVLTDDGNVYSSGINDNGNLGDGTFVDQSTPVRFGIPPLSSVQLFPKQSDQTAITWGESMALLTEPMQAVGSRVFVDDNNNGTLDSGETGVNGIQMNLYRDSDSNGVPDGASVSTQTTTTFNSEDGYYLFDALAPRTYLVGATIDGTEYLSDPTPLNSTGSGWVLGASTLIEGNVNFGIPTDGGTPSTGGGPSGTPSPNEASGEPLAPTGLSAITVFAMAVVLIGSSSALILAWRNSLQRKELL